MNIDWQQIITALGGYTIFAAAIAWLAQTVIAHILSKDIERYKTKLDDEAKLHQKELELSLQSQFAIALAKTSSELQTIAKENEIRYTKLHEKRVTVISDFYEKLEEIYGNTSLLILKLKRQSAKDHIEHARELWIKCGEVSRLFKKNKLYFSKSLADEIEQFLSIISAPSSTYVWSKVDETVDEDILKILEEWSAKGRDAGRIRQLIEDEFRGMLGINETVS